MVTIQQQHIQKKDNDPREISENKNCGNLQLLDKEEFQVLQQFEHLTSELQVESERLFAKIAKQNAQYHHSHSPSNSSHSIGASEHGRSEVSTSSGSQHSLSKSISSQLYKLDILSWYKSYKSKKREMKIQLLFNSLLPKLKNASETLHIWLQHVSNKKNEAMSQAIKSYTDVKSAMEICQSHIDIYDDIFNDCLQIGIDLKKEFLDLKHSYDFIKEISHTKEMKVHSSVAISNNAETINVQEATAVCGNIMDEPHDTVQDIAYPISTFNEDTKPEPARWHGYPEPQGNNIHILKSVSTASLASINSAKHNSKQSELSQTDTNMNHHASVSLLNPILNLFHSNEKSHSTQSPPSSTSTNSSSRQINRRLSLENASILNTFRNLYSSSKSSSKSSSSFSDYQQEHSTSNEAFNSSLLQLSISSAHSLSNDNSFSISRANCSMNNLLIEANNNAMIHELDNIFDESIMNEKLNDQISSNDELKTIIQHMEQLRQVKFAISKLMIEIKEAREVAMINKRKCKHFHDELEQVIHSDSSNVSSYQSLSLDSQVLHQDPSYRHGDNSSYCSSPVSLFHQSMNPDAIEDDLCRCNGTSISSDDLHLLHENTIPCNSKASSDILPASHQLVVDMKAIEDSTAISADNSLVDLKKFLIEEDLIRKQLLTVQHLIDVTNEQMLVE